MLTEHQEQVLFVNWFELQFPKVKIFAIPNGGNRNIVTAKKLKAEGVRKGVPDLFIPEWRLWVEMKRKKAGRLSLEQSEWIIYLKDCGYSVIVGEGFEDAKSKVIGFSLSGVGNES